MTSAAEGHFKTEAGRSSTREIERSSRVTVIEPPFQSIQH